MPSGLMSKGTKPRGKQVKTGNSVTENSQLQEEEHERRVTYGAVTHQPLAGISEPQHFTPRLKHPSLVLMPNSAVSLGGGKSLQGRKWRSSWYKGSLPGLQPCFLPYVSMIAVHWLHASCGDHQDLLEAKPNSGAEHNITPSWLFFLS